MLALLFLEVNDRSTAISLVFSGLYALLTGYLIIRSTFLPWILGAISVIAGLGWLTFLYLPLGYAAFPVPCAFRPAGGISTDPVAARVRLG